MYQDNRLNLASGLLACAITLTLRIDILSLSGTEAAQFTFQNNCKYTVWPGLLPNGGWPLLAQGGFELLAGQSTIVDAPIGWSGRFWGRTGCSFSNTPSLGGAACETGDCGSKVECNGAGATPPATLAEFTLAGAQAGAKDFYDVSLVDGYNIPIAILPSPRKSNSTDTALSQQFINAAASEDHYVCLITTIHQRSCI
ncbi:hypothetical protein KP509_30G018400 [Ceratopteris richardii]|uniref:Thaumatin-like protein n=1 Tax=Ceratopteris richardii TaxID=49495 RepID=A0A8T2R097_CERRI|nr:hypothetical protein KP509_30G018400 [Ceratopteris richardii]